MRQVILISLLILLTISCGRMRKQNQNAEMQTGTYIQIEAQTDTLSRVQITGTISETQKFEMFCAALANLSTAPNFVVVTVRNLNTGEVKEVCTEAPFVRGAIYRQTGKFSFTIDCNDYPNRYFEFSADSALWNISFDLYTISELEKYATTIDIYKIVQQVKNGGLQSITFGFDEEKQTWKEQTWEEIHKEQKMFAHIMFNNGIMMTRDCVAGNISSLKYFEQKDE